jgi:hypothetical protein
VLVLSTIVFGVQELLRLKKATEELPASHDVEHHHDHNSEGFRVTLNELAHEIPQSNNDLSVQSFNNMFLKSTRPIFIPIIDDLY